MDTAICPFARLFARPERTDGHAHDRTYHCYLHGCRHSGAPSSAREAGTLKRGNPRQRQLWRLDRRNRSSSLEGRRCVDSSSLRTRRASKPSLCPVGYFYNQLTCDSGAGNRVGCFESRVVGLGPQIGYIFPSANTIRDTSTSRVTKSSMRRTEPAIGMRG